jgi:hypothetical protein
MPYRAAVGTLLLFLGIVGVEHFAVPRLDPARHMISEYANGPGGALMVVGFLAWAASLASTAFLVASDARLSRRRAPQAVVAVLLAVATVGMVLTASFATQTVAGALPPGVDLSTNGRLHDLGSGITTVGVFAAIVASLRMMEVPAVYRAGTVSILLLAVVTDVALLAIGPAVGGIRQRALVFCGCVWQLSFLAVLEHRREPQRRDRDPQSL